MKKPNVLKLFSFLLLSALLIFICKDAYGQGPPVNSPNTRANVIRYVKNTIENASQEKPKIFTTSDKYVRFMMAPPGTSFSVDQAYRNLPQQAANRFLNNWSGLFVNFSLRNSFKIIRNEADKSNNHYVRYQQYYNSVEVFGAQLNCMVNASGGVVAILSDIMRDTEPLDSGRISLNPNLTTLNAKISVLKHLSNEYPNMKFEVTEPNLMIFDPKVVGRAGEIRLVWNMKVNSTIAGAVSEGILIDAQNAEIVFVQSFIYNGRNRNIYDYSSVEGTPPPPTGPPARGENDDETDVLEVDNAWEYLGNVYDFYYSHHSRDSYDGSGGYLIAAVLYQDNNYPEYNDAIWFDNPSPNQSYMLIHSGYALIDVIGHEFTHGVTCRASCLNNAATESGAIFESFSDMWGSWIDQEVNRDSDDWIIAEDDQINGPWRDMENPHDSQWYSGPEFLYEPYKWTNDTSNINFYTHTNCGVGNKLCYLLTSGDTFRDYNISRMGMIETSKLFYECQCHWLTSSADYEDLGFGLQIAAIIWQFSDTDRINVANACRAVGIYDASFAFEVKDSSGYTTTFFDDEGNLFLKGSFYYGGSPSLTENDEFVIKNSQSNVIAIIDNESGDMKISGSLYDEQTNMSGANNFIVKDSVGDTVAYIDNSGNLYMTGKVIERK